MALLLGVLLAIALSVVENAEPAVDYAAAPTPIDKVPSSQFDIDALGLLSASPSPTPDVEWWTHKRVREWIEFEKNVYHPPSKS